MHNFCRMSPPLLTRRPHCRACNSALSSALLEGDERGEAACHLACISLCRLLACPGVFCPDSPCVCAVGGVGVNSENSQGYCVKTDSSANEVIAGLARASAVRDSGASSNHTVAIAVGCAVGGAVLLIIVVAIGVSIMVRRRRKERSLGSAELASIRSLPMVSPSKSSLLSLLSIVWFCWSGAIPAKVHVFWHSCVMAPQRFSLCPCVTRLCMCRQTCACDDLGGVLWDLEVLFCCVVCSRACHRRRVTAYDALKRLSRTSRSNRTFCSTAACAAWGRWMRSR